MPPKGRSGGKTVFNGEVSSGHVVLHVYHLPRANNNRVLVSLDLSANAHTYRTLCNTDGGPNYGEADMSAFCKAIAQAVEEKIVHDVKRQASCGIVAHNCNYGNGMLNIAFTCGKSSSNARITAGYILNSLKPSSSVYADNMRKLEDPDGKTLKPSSDAFDACLGELGRALKKVTVMLVGGAKLDREGANDMCSKINSKIKPVSGSGKVPTHPKVTVEYPSKYEVIPFKGADGVILYFYYTSAQSKGRLYDEELVLDRGLKGSLESADMKKTWADKISKAWKVQPGIGLAYLGAEAGYFSAEALVKLCKGSWSAGDIKAVL